MVGIFALGVQYERSERELSKVMLCQRAFGLSLARIHFENWDEHYRVGEFVRLSRVMSISARALWRQ
jgi:hypothetical protein